MSRSLGRISPKSGGSGDPDRPGARMPIKIAAKITGREAYFRETIAPLFNLPGVEYIGEIDERSKSESSVRRAPCCFRSNWRSRSGCP